ncbi:MAG: phosphatase PAP2 family protein [Nitrospirae bacterium]|nr:phosphatase PAP2 family protein [Nitrospirota bacterium]
MDASFPSGHTATAFAILLPWAFYYPHMVTYGLLVIGGGAAVARMQRQKHWLTDVLAGGTLGISMAYWLSRKHQGRRSNRSVAPTVGPGSVGLTMQVTF